MRRLAAAAFLATGLLAACGHTDRPEGVVERWLVSLNQGSAGRPDQYAAGRVSDQILPGWQRCDPGALEVIEVGIGGMFPAREGQVALAPYRVRYSHDIADLCGRPVPAAGPTDGFAELFRRPAGDWSVVRLIERRRGDETLPLPSSGGPPLAEAPEEIWLAATLAGLALCGLVALLMAAMPRPAPVSTEPADTTEARGL
ncbi:MAG: hypothetical protein ACJ77A_05565 [Actinomycetota bacterium]